MKRAAVALLLLAAITAIVLAVPSTGAAAGSAANDSSLSWTFRGFNYPSWWHDEYQSQASADSLTQVAATGANWVAIVPTQYMDTVNANVMAPENGGAGRTASDDAVAKAIDDAHARGLKVLIKPHVDILDGTTRVDIRPSDPATWFANYSRMMADYAALAEAHHVELFSVGTELAGVSDQSYYSYWVDVIGGVRAAYHGQITYAASMNEYGYVSFYGLLDYLGLDLYFPLSDSSEPTLDELMTGWTNYRGYYGEADWIASIERWQSYWNKPVIFTELGYRSIKYVGLTPWDSSPGTYDGFNQARAYEAAFSVLGNKPWLAGVFWWDWMVGDNTAGPGNTDYTVHGKPAEAVVTSWFSTGAPPQPSLQAAQNSTNWASYADFQDRRLTVSYGITNTGNSVAVSGSLIGSQQSNGVETLTSLPISIGSVQPGATDIVTISYKVPQGVDTFRTVLFSTCVDTTGSLRYFPYAPQA